MEYSKIVIVGPKEIIFSFKALGVDTEFSVSVDETILKIKELKKSKKYAVIFIFESHAKNINIDEYKKLTADPLPAIIALPGPEGSTGFGLQRLGQIVEKAIGSNILK